jgi:hypothetical protein
MSDEKEPDEIWIADIENLSINPTGQSGVIGSFFACQMTFEKD